MPNLLKKIFNFGGDQGGQSVIGVDIGSSAIKIVQLKKVRGTAVLETYGALALGPYAKQDIGRAVNLPEPQMIEALKTLVREARITSPDAGIAIPFGASLMPLVEMPALGEKELAQIIPIEARKYIPVPINEVEFDWWVIPKREQLIPGATQMTGQQAVQPPQQPQQPAPQAPQVAPPMGAVPPQTPNLRGGTPGFVPPPQPVMQQAPLRGGVPGASSPVQQQPQTQKKVDVLIVAIHKETISKYHKISRGAGMQPSFFEIEVFSAVRSVLDQDLSPVMVLDIGAGATKLYVVEHGVVRDSHIINKGSQDVTLALSQSLSIPVIQAEEMKRTLGMGGQSAEEQNLAAIMQTSMSYIFSEARRMLESYQRKNRAIISKVVLTGGGAVLKGLHDYAAKEFAVEVVMGDPFAKVDTPAFATDILKSAGPEFSVALGLALRKLQDLDSR